MARIIKKGPSPEVEKKVTCRGCGSIIGYVENDVKSYSGTDYTGGADGREWVNCPNCGKEIVIRSW